MPGLICCPRRSLPGCVNRMTPRKELSGTSGNVTFASPVGAPFGAVLTSQISQTVPLGPVTLAPSFCNNDAKPAGTSDGGAPAGSALYCASAATAAITPQTTTFERVINSVDAVARRTDSAGAC